MLTSDEQQFLKVRVLELVKDADEIRIAFVEQDLKKMLKSVHYVSVLSRLLLTWMAEKKVFREEMPSWIEREEHELRDALRKLREAKKAETLTTLAEMSKRITPKEKTE